MLTSASNVADFYTKHVKAYKEAHDDVGARQPRDGGIRWGDVGWRER